MATLLPHHAQPARRTDPVVAVASSVIGWLSKRRVVDTLWALASGVTGGGMVSLFILAVAR